MPSQLALSLALLSTNVGKKSATDPWEKEQRRKETPINAISDSMRARHGKLFLLPINLAHSTTMFTVHTYALRSLFEAGSLWRTIPTRVDCSFGPVYPFKRILFFGRIGVWSF